MVAIFDYCYIDCSTGNQKGGWVRLNMEIEEVIVLAKKFLVKQGFHTTQVITEEPTGKLSIMVLQFDDHTKDMAIEALRNFVFNKGIERYWFITEAWMLTPKAGEDLYIRPSKSKDRTEALLVLEFKKDMTNKGRIFPFNRLRNKIVFEENMMSDKDAVEHSSVWNVFLEKEGVNERLDKVGADLEDEFIRKAAKDFSKKYAKHFMECSDEERKTILSSVMGDFEERVKKQKAKIITKEDDINGQK